MEMIKTSPQISQLSRFNRLGQELGQQLITEQGWHKVLTKSKGIEGMTLMEGR